MAEPCPDCVTPPLCPQLTVVVKYFFQFGFFPWTTSSYRGINADRPFAMPNIIGVEKKDGYVLFDLIQLLALFFHRSILKVPGSIPAEPRPLKAAFRGGGSLGRTFVRRK